MNRKIIGKALMTMIIPAAMIMSGNGCASLKAAHHKYVMRGSILMVAGNEAYLCIGSNDGAQVGQKFDVYRIIPQGIAQPGKGGTSGIKFRKEKTGSIKITQIVDEHYAKADIVRGNVQKDYVAELEFPLDCENNKGK